MVSIEVHTTKTKPKKKTKTRQTLKCGMSPVPLRLVEHFRHKENPLTVGEESSSQLKRQLGECVFSFEAIVDCGADSTLSSAVGVPLL